MSGFFGPNGGGVASLNGRTGDVTIEQPDVATALGYEPCGEDHPHIIADTTGLQTALDGKQAAGNYSPATHGHGIADVTGLQGALDGKQAAGSYAAASHSHTKADVGLSNVDNTADTGKPVSSAQQAALDAKAPLANPPFTGAVTTTGSLGFAAGAGGTVTQATSKATGVTLNKAHGLVTMNAAALAAATIVSHTLTNSAIAASDQVICSHVSGGTSGAYTINAFPGAGSAVISLRNNTAGSLSQAVVYRFTVVKGVNA